MFKEQSQPEKIKTGQRPTLAGLTTTIGVEDLTSVFGMGTGVAPPL